MDRRTNGRKGAQIRAGSGISGSRYPKISRVPKLKIGFGYPRNCIMGSIIY